MSCENKPLTKSDVMWANYKALSLWAAIVLAISLALVRWGPENACEVSCGAPGGESIRGMCYCLVPVDAVRKGGE